MFIRMPEDFAALPSDQRVDILRARELDLAAQIRARELDPDVIAAQAAFLAVQNRARELDQDINGEKKVR